MNRLLRRRFQARLITAVLLLGVFPLLRGIYGERLLLHLLITLVFSTLTTVGYGDITPATEAAKAWRWSRRLSASSISRCWSRN